MRTFFMSSRGKGARSLWVFLCCLLFLRCYVDLNNGPERFCYASSSNEDNLQEGGENVAEFTSQTLGDGRPPAGDAVLRLPIWRSNREWASLPGNPGVPIFEERIFPERRNALGAESYAGVTTHPERVTSIPVCVKGFVELLLKHAFDIVVHNQQLYLSTRRQHRMHKPETQRVDEGDFEEGKEKIAGSEPDDLVGGQQVPEEKVAKDRLKERLAEHVNRSILGLMAEPYKSLAFAGLSAWRREHTNSNNNEIERGKHHSSSSWSSSAQTSWPRTNRNRVFPRLLTPQTPQNTDQATVGEGLGRIQQFLQTTALLSHLENNPQIRDLTAVLRDIGRVPLPNEPQDAAVYLSFLTEDEDAMALWRAHVVRHVFEHITFTSLCSAEPPAAAAAAAEGDEEDKEEMQVSGADKEKNKKARQMEQEKLSAREGMQMYSPFIQWLRDAGESIDLLFPDAAAPSGIEDDEKEENGRGERESGRREGEKEDSTDVFRLLLNADWKGRHKLLLKKLQEEFWMSRPASSTAALQMIQRARDKSNMESGDLDEEREDDKELRDASEEKKTPGVWTPEVSLRFRYVSMKDAQRTMGTFLTSNLHPELGFRRGTKLPPQETPRSSSKTAARTTHAEEEEKEAWQEETETDLPIDNKDATEQGDAQQEEEGEIPEHFDAREAFPVCKDIIGHVRDQGNCGSCWAFSSTTSFNDRLCIKSGGEMQQLLSPQHTTSCCNPLLCASFGCNGGEPGLAWRWFHTAGIVSGGDFDTLHKGETCWPYEIPFCNHHANSPFPECAGDEGETETPQCRSQCEEEEYTKKVHPFTQDLHRASRAFSFPTRQHAKRDIMRAGSISASFMVYEDFLNYKQGVYKHVYGLPLGGHAIKVVGWGVEGGEEYWLMVNSWNSYWGDNGLVKIRMGEAGVDEDLLAGDVAWKPQVQKLAEDKKSSDVTLGAEPSTATFREL